jgi:hypothetical protein
MSQSQSMMLITSSWGEKKTFRLMPIDLNCPFTEGIYDPDGKVLVMISKDKKESFHMLAKLDEQGDPLKLKRPRANMKPFPEERKALETYQEHYISETKEIEQVISMFAVNKEDYDYKSIMAGLVTPEVPKLNLVQP